MATPHAHTHRWHYATPADLPVGASALYRHREPATVLEVQRTPTGRTQWLARLDETGRHVVVKAAGVFGTAAPTARPAY